MRLLLLEDDLILGEGLRDFLRAEGHTVDWVTRVAEAEASLASPYDALLVDWQLPDGSGLAWVRRLRAKGNTRPVLMLTARDLLSDRIVGLDAGADDYLVKPFAPEELVARLRAISRRSTGAAASEIRIGEVTIDLAAHTATRDGAEVQLTAREWSVLEALLLRRGRLVAKSDLEELSAGLESEASSNVLEVHVSGLRRKLGRELIETARGLGYRIPA